jgi:hypothetical protein
MELQQDQMTIDRVVFQNRLQAVAPGLSTDGKLDQSDCFVFHRGLLQTMRRHLACSIVSDIDLQGAIKAERLLKWVQKVNCEKLLLKLRNGKLKILTPKGDKVVLLVSNPNLPTDWIDPPREYIALPAKFAEAISTSYRCAQQKTDVVSYNVHIHPKWIEACDGSQLIRYELVTGFESSVLIRRDVAKALAEAEICEFSKAARWIHFRNKSELTLSCPLDETPYPNLSSHTKVEGTRTKLPKHLVEALDRIVLFENGNQIKVHLEANNMCVRGEGVDGYSEKVFRKLIYNGPPMDFQISPLVLTEVARRDSECIVAKDKMMIQGDNFKYIVSLYSNM